MVEDIPIGRKINIILVGTVVAVLVVFMIEVIFAEILVRFIIDIYGERAILYLITFGLLILSFFVSILIGFYMAEGISINSVIRASIMALFTNFVFLIIISYLFLLIFYPIVFSSVEGFAVIIIFPDVIINFGVFVLGHPIYLFMLSTLTYYLFFVIYLEAFFKLKNMNLNPKPTYRW